MALTGSHIRRIAGAVLVGVGLSLVSSAPAVAADAATSIVGGKPTTIERWPWQVALARSVEQSPKLSPRKRQTCGGSLLTPTVVLTAGHCAVDIETKGLDQYSVISGRTSLDDTSSGIETRIKAVAFPLTPNGFPRFLLQDGWDIALIELESPADGQPIKLLGPDERNIAGPGRRLIETGWGTTDDMRQVRPPTLMMGGTNIQPPSICASLSADFETVSQVCLGDARGRQANCFGDSGGPAVTATSDGYRLVGATSEGTTFFCGGTYPNIDAFVAGQDLRSWIRQEVLARTGIDPVGSGATANPVGPLCKVPKIRNVPARSAKRQLREAGCRRIRVKRVNLSHIRSAKNMDGRVLGTGPAAGWLWDPRDPIEIGVAVWRARK